jgi:ParB-like chromosome segregation protein Spo0J
MYSMRIERMLLSEMHGAEYNPRKRLGPDDRQFKALVQSIDEYGFVEPIIYNKRTKNIVGGHQRYEVLQAKGVKEIEVVVVDLTLEKEKALNIALNRITGEWDQTKLAQLLDELVKVPDFKIESIGFTAPDVDELIHRTLNQDAGDNSFDVDAELKKNVPVVTKTGDLVVLGMHGQHRLLCGDCTKPADISAVLGEFRARHCATPIRRIP